MKKQNQGLRMYGPGTYEDVEKEILQEGLSRPTMAETASLVYDSFFNKLNKKQSNEIKKIIKDKELWAFTGVLYIPKKGAYIQDYPEIRDGMPYIDESDLEKKLSKNNPNVRFVPFGYKIGDMTPKELAKNKFVIGLAGKEGAEKLAEVAGKYKDDPYLWCQESVSIPITRVFAVVSDHLNYLPLDLDIRRLGILNSCGDRDGYAFRVQKKTNRNK